MVEIIAGPMFSGKTTELLRRLGAESLPSYLIRPERDTRYPDEKLTHDRAETPATVTVRRGLGWPPGACVGIDEFHLLSSAEQATICNQLAAGKIGCVRLILCGLLFKYNRTRFAWFGRLRPFASGITILRANCRGCGAPTEYQRCITGKIVNAGPADYRNECARCWGGDAGG